MAKGRKGKQKNSRSNGEQRPKYDPKYSFDVKREESLRSIQERDPGKRTSWHWSEVWQEAHEDAFVVAKMVRGDLLKEVHDSLERAIAEGKPFEAWKKEILPKLEGEWIGKTVGQLWDELPESEKKGRKAPEGKDRDKVITANRLKTIYEVNMRVARARERYKQLVDRKDALPYWQYVSLQDNRARAGHKKANNLVFRHDDVFWNTHYPPNGWRCRCYVVPVDEKIIKANGLRIATGEGHIYWGNKKGLDYAVYDGIRPHLECDPGWSYCVGRENRLKQTAAEKEKSYPPDLQKQAQKAQAEHDKQKEQQAQQDKAKQDAQQQSTEQAQQSPGNEQAQQDNQTAQQPTGGEQPGTEKQKAEAEKKATEQQKAQQQKAEQKQQQQKDTEQEKAQQRAAEQRQADKPASRAKGSEAVYDKTKTALDRNRAVEAVNKAVNDAQKMANEAVREVAQGLASAEDSIKHIEDIREVLRSDFGGIAVEDTAYKRLDQQIAEAKNKIEQAEAIRQTLEKAEQSIRKAGAAITKEASSIKAGAPSASALSRALVLADRGASELSALVRLSSDAATDSENSLREVLHITSSELLERTREAAKNAADPDLRKYLEGVASHLSKLLEKKAPLRDIASALKDTAQSFGQIEHFTSKKHGDSEQNEQTAANNVHHSIEQLRENADKEGKIPAFSEEPAVPYEKKEDVEDDNGKVIGIRYINPLYKSIEEAQQIMKNYKIEHALAFNEAGACLCEIVGTEEDVDIKLSDNVVGKIILIHNHPKGTIFSSSDLIYAYFNRELIKELRVVCGDYTYIYNPKICTLLEFEQAVLEVREIIEKRDKELLKTMHSDKDLYYTYREEIWEYLITHRKGVTVIKNKEGMP